MRTAFVAVGIAAIVAVVPASLAHGAPTLVRGKTASNGLRLDAGEQAGISVAVPVGRVWVDAKSLAGEPSYVRRTKGKEGVTIVEVSTTPFLPELPGAGGTIGRAAELPASW